MDRHVTSEMFSQSIRPLCADTKPSPCAPPSCWQPPLSLGTETVMHNLHARAIFCSLGRTSFLNSVPLSEWQMTGGPKYLMATLNCTTRGDGCCSATCMHPECPCLQYHVALQHASTSSARLHHSHQKAEEMQSYRLMHALRLAPQAQGNGCSGPSSPGPNPLLSNCRMSIRSIWTLRQGFMQMMGHKGARCVLV